MQVLKLIRIKMNWKLVNSKLIGIWELIPSPIYSFTKTSRLFDIRLVIEWMDPCSIFSQEEKNFVSKDVRGNDSLTNQAENDDTHLLWCLPKPRTIWNAEGMKARSQSTATGASPGLCICLPAMSLSKPPGLTNDWISLQKPCKHWMEETQNHLLVSKLDYKFHEQESQCYTVISQHLWAFDWSSNV